MFILRAIGKDFQKWVKYFFLDILRSKLNLTEAPKYRETLWDFPKYEKGSTMSSSIFQARESNTILVHESIVYHI
jgi:hypothetical protein